MAVNTKAIKNRIKSVRNIKKITKAMELVSAAKMRKAVQAALATRTYALYARELLQGLARVSTKSPLLAKRDQKKVLVILISSNRGLCGSFNANAMKKARELIRTLSGETKQIEMIGIGRRSAAFAKKYNYPLVGVYDALSEKPQFDDVLALSHFAMKAFETKTYDAVYIVYTHFKSSLAQEPVTTKLLPVSSKEIDVMMERLDTTISSNETSFPKETLFEPSKTVIMETVLPRLVETEVYQTLLESAASEHSARMMAMRSATDAAGDIMSELQLTFNKARQGAITQEIAEIAGGAAALHG